MDTLTEILNYLVEEVPSERSSFAPEENLLAQGIIDSMGLVKLVAFLERRFGFETSDEDLVPENFSTLEMIRDFVERKRTV